MCHTLQPRHARAPLAISQRDPTGHNLQGHFLRVLLPSTNSTNKFHYAQKPCRKIKGVMWLLCQHPDKIWGLGLLLQWCQSSRSLIS